jgi:hypothetical protein
VLCTHPNAIILAFDHYLSDLVLADTELAFAAHEYEGRAPKRWRVSSQRIRGVDPVPKKRLSA